MNAKYNLEVNQMTHNTKIRKQYGAVESVLNVGRTNNNEIYVDVRIYRYGGTIEVGDIALTQAEWDQINDNLEEPTQKLFICPECGDIVTDDDILESLTNGGFGMCMCKFGNGSRIFVDYDDYDPKLDPPITPDEIRLIESLRVLTGTD